MRIMSIQYLRGLAAVAVLIAHAVQYPMPVPNFDWIRLGRIGVILFFVISGFIMVFVTGQGPFAPGDFLKRRLLRIVPLYWVATFAVAAMTIAAPSAFKTSVFGVWHLVASVMFIPHVSPAGDEAPLLKLGWTLNYEMFFYACFALLCFTSAARRIGVLTVAFALMILLGLVFEPANVLLNTYTSYLLLAFCLGGWLGILHQAGALERHRRTLTSLFVLLLLLFCWGSFFLERGTRGADLTGAAMILASGAVVALGLANERRIPTWHPLELIGDASYSIYLGHIYAIGVVNITARRVLGADAPLIVLAILGTLAGAAAGLALYICVEKPLLRLFGMRVARKDDRVDQATPLEPVGGSRAPS